MRRSQLLRHLLAHPVSIPAKCVQLALRAAPAPPPASRFRFTREMLLAATVNDDFPIHHRQRPPSSSWLSGESLRASCTHVFDGRHRRVPAGVAGGDSIFVPAEFIDAFRRYGLPRLAVPFVLVTSNTDQDVPGPDAALLHDPRLLAWFAVNVTVRHPRLHPLPIGLRDHLASYAGLDAALAAPAPPRDLWLTSTLSVGNHADRHHALAVVAGLPEWSPSPPVPPRAYFERLRRSRFVLSPRGCGLDCHRTWEALLCGAIPIVLSSRLDPLYRDLPVWIVADWREITSTSLRAQDLALRAQPWELGLLRTDHWLRQIAASAHTAARVA